MGSSADPPADPKVQLQGVRLPNLLLELSNQIPGCTEKEMITYWRISAGRYAEHCVDAILEINKEMKVLKDVTAIAPQLQNRVDAEINRKVKERNDWSMSFLHSLVSDEQPGRSLQAEIEVLQCKAKKDELTIRRIEQAEQNLKVGNEVLQKKAQQDEGTIRPLQRQCDETTNYYRRLQEKVRTLESESRKKDMAIQRNLRENLVAKGFQCRREVNNKSRMEEAHRLECNTLRLKAQQAEAFSHSLSKELCLLQTAVEVSESSKLENNQSGTRLISANSTSWAAGGQNEDTNSSPNLENKMEPETEPRDRGDVVQSETILQKPQDSSSNLEKRMQPETESRDREHLVQSETILQKPLDSSVNLEKTMEPETEPQHRGDQIQSETILQKPQAAARKRVRKSERNVSPNVLLKSEGRTKQAPGAKKERREE